VPIPIVLVLVCHRAQGDGDMYMCTSCAIRHTVPTTAARCTDIDSQAQVTQVMYNTDIVVPVAVVVVQA